MTSNCEKNTNEVLSKAYPSANQWSCFPFDTFDFNKSVKTIRKTLNEQKESFSTDVTENRIIELDNLSYKEKQEKINKIIFGLILSVPLIIFIILGMLGVISEKIVLFVLIAVVIIFLIVFYSKNKQYSVNKLFKKTVSSITITGDDWVKKNCDCPSED